jgi:hypothetical protein
LVARGVYNSSSTRSYGEEVRAMLSKRTPELRAFVRRGYNAPSE